MMNESVIRTSAIRSLALFVLLIGSSSGCGPFFLIPGGQLSGSPSKLPSNWEFTKEINTIQLESRPSEPYSVNIWVTSVGDSLYLHAGANRSNWIENIEADPRVRIQILDQVYELVATRVDDADEFSRFADAYEEKYGSRPRNENVDEAYLMRLGPR